jgi:hypothetical protein
MKIRLGTLRLIIREAFTPPVGSLKGRVAFSTVAHLQDKLDDQLERGIISFEEYEKQFDDILSSVGWTAKDYEDEVDRRWDYIENRDEPVFARPYGPN